MPIMLRDKKMQKILDGLIGKPANMANPKMTKRSSKVNQQLINQESSRLR